MKKQEKIGLDFVIDKLTNSIENVNSGDSFPTEVSLLTQIELKSITKKTVGNLIGRRKLKFQNEIYLNLQLLITQTLYKE